ncbi:hypothetical protein CAter282_2140 [Collimonas arenae]|uniref:Uncharacterized protein n=1 Tax=Collimonas arenae TaxID=279058 RepID=A0A127PRL5_9BURK|nr:hypothetical protein CAter10_2332 [Collimonas arenae]AMP09896.1 hypothetical protein CAter282_2140 [Collimonas arenae]
MDGILTTNLQILILHTFSAEKKIATTLPMLDVRDKIA